MRVAPTSTHVTEVKCGILTSPARVYLPTHSLTHSRTHARTLSPTHFLAHLRGHENLLQKLVLEEMERRRECWGHWSRHQQQRHLQRELLGADKAEKAGGGGGDGWTGRGREHGRVGTFAVEKALLMYDGVNGDDGGGGGGSGSSYGFLPTGADGDSAGKSKGKGKGRVENGKSTLALDSGLSATCTYRQGCSICAKSVVKCSRPVLPSAAPPTVPTQHADVAGTSTGNQIKLLFMLVVVVPIGCVVGWSVGWMIGCLFVCLFFVSLP